MIKVYLDSSALNRIFDDQSQPRIYIEASAMVVIFALLEQDRLSFVSSDVLNYELSKNPYPERYRFVRTLLAGAHQHYAISAPMVKRAKQMEKAGIKALDALHIACAEAASVKTFITCDDKLLKSKVPKISVLSPPQFVVNLTHEVHNNGNSK